jgi:hypothetical protein
MKFGLKRKHVYILLLNGKVQNYDKYSVSNMGNVRNDKFNRILKPGIDTNGYYAVNL